MGLLVSTRTLFGVGLAVIVIVALASLVVVQQMIIQKMSGQTQYVTQYITQPQAWTQTTSQASGPYILVTYYGQSNSTEYGCVPSSGDTFLAVHVTIENLGYSSISTGGDWYAVINNQEYAGRGGCIGQLGIMDVLNGLSVTGWLLFEVPANYGTFSIVWVPETLSGLNVVTMNYNIQYVHQ